MKHPETAELVKLALAGAAKADPAVNTLEALGERLAVGPRTIYRWSAGGVAAEGLVGMVLREVAAGWLPRARA